MALRNMIGNEKAAERLIQTVRTGTVSHAYLFEGDGHVDKQAWAKEFAKAILCQNSKQGDACDTCVSCRKLDHGNYEDFIEICADGNSIKDEAIVALQEELAKKPYGGNRHVAVISSADTMTLRAQNRLLKTLEEPAPGTVIMLLSENTEHLAVTILSRCIIFRLHGEASEESELGKEAMILAQNFAKLALRKEKFYKLSESLGEAAQKKDLAYAFLDCLERRYRDMVISPYDRTGELLYYDEERQKLKEQGRLLKTEELARAVCAIEGARLDLNRNINVAYALRSMILKS